MDNEGVKTKLKKRCPLRDFKNCFSDCAWYRKSEFIDPGQCALTAIVWMLEDISEDINEANL